ncbi:hypothetical protein OG607_26610 [Streptomyces sp. NBC_01537]|uniref:hypothetical protein n=1 Tax=Streptomyces sp. NBC_01537 TaxID=2903896 RepID=UPI003866FF77
MRTPHWSSALSRFKAAAAILLGLRPAHAADPALPLVRTEAFGLKAHPAGRLPPDGEPTVDGHGTTPW